MQAKRNQSVRNIAINTNVKHGKTICKILVFFIALIPCAELIIDTVQNDLGANPVEELTARTGEWTLRFLIISLSITPLRFITRIKHINNYRRMMGLFVFFYSVLHLSIFIVLEHAMDAKLIIDEITTNNVVQTGLLAFLLLTALAVTSNKVAMKTLRKNWKKLHRLIYLVALLAILHYIILVKADYSQPLLYGTLVTSLLVIRLYQRYKKTPTI